MRTNNPRLCLKSARWRCLLCALLFFLPVGAQDALPVCPDAQPPALLFDTLCTYRQRTDTVALPCIALPAAFQQLQANCLTDSAAALSPFWEKLRLLRSGAATDTVRIVHIGDSHIRGHIFPRTAGQLLQQAFGALSYTDMGINGAFCATFTRLDRIEAIAALRPDLLILSFGTNESHNRNYNPVLHWQQIDHLVGALRHRLPGVPLLLTTPPGAYESFRKRRYRRTYKINPRTPVAVSTICSYAAAHEMAVWNIYHILGGSQRACLNWWEAALMRPDRIHFMPDGYCLQGQLLFQALLTAYNDYVQY